MRHPIIILLLLGNSILNSQNLVPNGGFEQSKPQCGLSMSPSDFNMQTTGWQSYTAGSPDIHKLGLPSSCANAATGATASLTWGSEMPATDSTYAALIAYCSSCASETREYITIQLSSPLQQGISYYFSMKVSLADNSGYASNNLGAYFSNTTPTSQGWLHLNHIPQIEFTSVVSNTTGWQTLTGTVTPSATLNYLTIGNFRSDAATTKIPISTEIFSTYFVDDICLSSQEGICLTGGITGVQRVSGEPVFLYPNPVQDFLMLGGEPEGSLTLLITDLTGKEVVKFQDVSAKSFDLRFLEPGYYAYVLSDDAGGIKRGKLLKK